MQTQTLTEIRLGALDVIIAWMRTHEDTHALELDQSITTMYHRVSILQLEQVRTLLVHYISADDSDGHHDLKNCYNAIITAYKKHKNWD